MNITRELQALANWTTKDLHADKGWVFPLTEKESRHLRDITLAAFDPNRDLFEYSLSEFELGPAEATLKKAIKQAETQLNQSGRLLIRKSGTEPLIRVMAEGEDLELIKTVVEELVSIIERTQQA